MQSAGDIGYEHAQIGDEYWAALPLTWNVSDEDLRITRAEFGHVKVKAKSGADHYYIARIKVTGPVDEALKDCRYWYDQDGEHYRQQLDCSTIIRLGPPIVYDDV
ncbi:hypothetical protein [Streptomyces sp. NPDC002779]|uniref:hypothetical protein n=1 Tax=Streptomyces sp. NPDC002779 TaxID=3364664 RepID=UPI0036CCE2CD